ncbi:unnamed protein product [Adineta steineri]|uniref:Uncharacterized protein n=1 Tax=Adineta steineri TaxID=433720 RepID=A0A819KK06_9BILA|nr:unnamed protein product [Adineta steineri]CAF3946290.1 unnamed protein product [Adineta steineri]
MATITLTVTPFQNDQEVQKLIDLAYSDTIEDKREAINKINELEARISQLPMGLGSLKHILKVEIIRAEQQEQNKMDENSALQYACAVAVLKFVDAVSVPYRVHHSRLSYRNIAKQVDLPGNIISLRHDIAHHHELPSLHDLLAAVDFSKQWLRKNCLDELIETMALFSQGSYSELLDIIAQETVQAYVEARLNFLMKRSKKRLRIADERTEEIRKALQMCNGKEMMAEVFVQCGNFIMTPKQLTRLGNDAESSDLLPKCVIQFWKPIIQLIIQDTSLISLIIDKILNFISDYYQLTSNDYSIIDQQRIGWIFYLIEQPTIKLDLSSVFIRLVRILQPWFAESLSQMVVRMADNNNGTRQTLISEQKRDMLLRTISMFANPFENIDNDQVSTASSIEIFPRNELYKQELLMFKKRSILAEVPVGLANSEDEQNLEMNIDLSKTDRNFLGCISKPKSMSSLPTKRKRTSSPTIDSKLFHDLLYPRHSYRY